MPQAKPAEKEKTPGTAPCVRRIAGRGREAGRCRRRPSNRRSPRKWKTFYKPGDAGTPAQQVELAKEVVEAAEKSTKPEEQFVLLRKASELAVKAGDAALMFQAVDRMAAEFHWTAWPSSKAVGQAGRRGQDRRRHQMRWWTAPMR